MTSQKRSKWFPISQKPDLPGMYELRDFERTYLGRVRWTGKKWIDSTDPEYQFWLEEGDQWRGLAEKPE